MEEIVKGQLKTQEVAKRVLKSYNRFESNGQPKEAQA